VATFHSQETTHGELNRVEDLAESGTSMAFGWWQDQREQVKHHGALRLHRDCNQRQCCISLAVDAMKAELLPDHSAGELLSLGQVRSFPKHSVILTEGEPGESLYVIVAGKVNVFLSDEQGREVVLGTCGPGDYLGEMALDGGPRSASVMCLESSSFLVVTRQALHAKIAADPDFALELLSAVISRARLMTDMVKNLALLDVYGRVARLLLGLAVEAADGTLVVSETLTQQNIAERVGASRDMVNRIIRDLSAGGYIAVTRRKISILRRPPARW
jgi:CRP/FNR family transcriptional regulator, cyclic AMP receptor protein